MESALAKSLYELVDETLHELEELKKSDRFKASEICLDGPGQDGIGGKPANGSLSKEEDDKEDDKEDKDLEKKEDDKDEDKEDDEEEDKDFEKKEDKKAKKDDKMCDKEHEDKEKKIAKELLDMHKEEMKKSIDATESLIKSYIDEKMSSFEEKLSRIYSLVDQMADTPAPAKGVTARSVPLFKSLDSDAAPLSKSAVANKLFELKKSGARVDSEDIARAETGYGLEEIVKKYQIS